METKKKNVLDFIPISAVENLEGELAVALAERDQADREVLRLEEEVRIWKQKLEEWQQLESWRQSRWDELQQELRVLREENLKLRNEGSKPSATNQ